MEPTTVSALILASATVGGSAIGAVVTFATFRRKNQEAQEQLRKDLHLISQQKMGDLRDRIATLTTEGRQKDHKLNECQGRHTECERQRLLLHTEVARLRALLGR